MTMSFGCAVAGPGSATTHTSARTLRSFIGSVMWEPSVRRIIAKDPAPGRATGVRSAEDLADLPCQAVGRERFLEQLGVRIEHAVVHDRVVRVPRHVEHLHPR